MDRHVAFRQAQGPELVERAALLAMTGMDSLIITQRLGIRSSSRNDKAVVAEVAPAAAIKEKPVVTIH